jgi:hypothetical protein
MATRADDNGPVKEFVFEDWLCEGFEGFCNRVKSKRVRLDTSKFKTHMRNARKEKLLAMRSLVDSFIEVVDKEEQTNDK